MDPSRPFTCPTCGNNVAWGTPTCGNCAADLRPYFGGSPLAGSPGTRIPGGFIRFLIILAALGAGAFFVQQPVRDAIDGFSDGFGDFDESIEIPDVRDRPRTGRSTKGYRGARELARDLNENGMVCRDIVVDSENEYISTGSCQAELRRAAFPAHVQINVYLREETLGAAGEILEDSPFDVVHADNWYVITGSREAARQVKRAIGGALQPAS